MTYFQKGWTPLHVACYNSNLEITELLLDEGSDPNNPDLVIFFEHNVFKMFFLDQPDNNSRKAKQPRQWPLPRISWQPSPFAGFRAFITAYTMRTRLSQAIRVALQLLTCVGAGLIFQKKRAQVLIQRKRCTLQKRNEQRRCHQLRSVRNLPILGPASLLAEHHN